MVSVGRNGSRGRSRERRERKLRIMVGAHLLYLVSVRTSTVGGTGKRSGAGLLGGMEREVRERWRKQVRIWFFSSHRSTKERMHRENSGSWISLQLLKCIVQGGYIG